MSVIQILNVPATENMLRAQEEVGVEYADGQFVEKPVSNISSEVAAQIIFLLKLAASKTRTVAIYDATMGYQCFPRDPKKFRKPDVSIVLNDRKKHLPAEFGLMPIPADLVVEVNSPNDYVSNVEEKVDEYLNAEFGVVWVVDPPTKTVTIHRSSGTVSRLHESDEIEVESVLPSFRCKVREFFP